MSIDVSSNKDSNTQYYNFVIQGITNWAWQFLILLSRREVVLLLWYGCYYKHSYIFATEKPVAKNTKWYNLPPFHASGIPFF